MQQGKSMTRGAEDGRIEDWKTIHEFPLGHCNPWT